MNATEPDKVPATKEVCAVNGADGVGFRLARSLSASRAAVYRALTDPEELGKWWGPEGFTAPSLDFDPQVGGRYRIAMQPPDGELFFLFGEFREVDPPARLTYTFRWDPPHADDRETIATVSLEERGDETGILVTQGPFATEARRALHKAGWTQSLERLEQLLLQRRTKARERVGKVPGFPGSEVAACV
jgi:uncharacterized protein YndB with AHSA1/START domain